MAGLVWECWAEPMNSGRMNQTKSDAGPRVEPGDRPDPDHQHRRRRARSQRTSPSQVGSGANGAMRAAKVGL